ncbi:probable BOI-related E3 ubiquitin-protein ligase 3 isoform X2 [Dioscorea cayenensis subsp. rotundata]|uniref:Probable BOI-related E3 ubiquitin-protein ligase 3 isoform X2 n=1 Tax=Dioscorea cayennensis subsp. rotundata TaxID=55577 RepID=A0AB40CPC3_DIOCR|nr:probable BOI-related E3 ubiquitin-protein ligase 3 isoform X2 [Dioscorea cayenensis subsp. rotundata]
MLITFLSNSVVMNINPEEYYTTFISPPPAPAPPPSFPSDTSSPFSSFPSQDFFSQLQLQHHLEIDHLITNHAEKVRQEMEERRTWVWRRVVAMAEEKVARKLRNKDEEIDRITRVNHALEERIKSLVIENQLWKDIARSNEAAAMLLRTNLDHLLASQDSHEEDVQSCSGGGGGAGEVGRRLCRRCGEEEAAVLVMPCRHLCLCLDCSPALDVCPVCKSSKNVAACCAREGHGGEGGWGYVRTGLEALCE